jgi:hypothetical protein
VLGSLERAELKSLDIGLSKGPNRVGVSLTSPEDVNIAVEEH